MHFKRLVLLTAKALGLTESKKTNPFPIHYHIWVHQENGGKIFGRKRTIVLAMLILLVVLNRSLK
jgi:predicted RNA-binding protein YlqC (UPF0109 family)